MTAIAEIKLCECGCGKPTPIAKETRRKKGHVKGQPTRFCPGHRESTAKPLEDRFWPKVNREGPVMPYMETQCWEWTAATIKTGHGVFNIGPKNKMAPAHRVAYELLRGPIEEEDGWRVTFRHLCQHTRCVNPEHLELVKVVTDARERVETAQQSGVTKLCECGCGQAAPIATMTDRKRGVVAGEPQRYVPGHNRALTPSFDPGQFAEGVAPEPEPRFPVHPVAGKVCQCDDPVILLDTDTDERCYKCGKLTLRMMMATLMFGMKNQRVRDRAEEMHLDEQSFLPSNVRQIIRTF